MSISSRNRVVATAVKSVDRLLAIVTGLSLLGVLALPAHAAELAEIQRRGYLIVGVKDNLRPLGFRGADGQLEGLEIDLAHQLAATLLGNPNAVTLQPLTNQDRLNAVANGQVDLVIARLTVTGSRSRLVNFSTPYYLDGTTLVTRNSSIQKISDLQQQPIAVLNDSSTIAVIRSYVPSARLVGVDSYEQAKALLDSGQAVAFAADASVLTGWVQDYPDYRTLPLFLSTAPLAVAMPRGLQYEALHNQVDRAIDQWQSQGGLQQRILYWGLPAAGLPRHDVPDR